LRRRLPVEAEVVPLPTCVRFHLVTGRFKRFPDGAWAAFDLTAEQKRQLWAAHREAYGRSGERVGCVRAADRKEAAGEEDHV
jgi:hypothetical protein